MRSRPKPNAKPVQRSGSYPTAANTLGSTMPAPATSSQSVRPFLSVHATLTSTDGSVKGKKCGITRTSRSPSSRCRKNVMVPFRCAKLSPSSTASPST